MLSLPFWNSLKSFRCYSTKPSRHLPQSLKSLGKSLKVNTKLRLKFQQEDLALDHATFVTNPVYYDWESFSRKQKYRTVLNKGTENSLNEILTFYPCEIQPLSWRVLNKDIEINLPTREHFMHFFFNCLQNSTRFFSIQLGCLLRAD